MPLKQAQRPDVVMADKEELLNERRSGSDEGS